MIDVAEIDSILLYPNRQLLTDDYDYPRIVIKLKDGSVYWLKHIDTYSSLEEYFKALSEYNWDERSLNYSPKNE